MDMLSTLDGAGICLEQRQSVQKTSSCTTFASSRPWVFLDQLTRYEDASPSEEARQACIGLTTDYRLLYASPCDS